MHTHTRSPADHGAHCPPRRGPACGSRALGSMAPAGRCALSHPRRCGVPHRDSSGWGFAGQCGFFRSVGSVVSSIRLENPYTEKVKNIKQA